MLKYFVVSDVHGHAALLKDALRCAGYDAENKEHLLICCGDLFDRGSENFEVLRFFERLNRKVMIMGNHEERLLEILNTGSLGGHDFMNGTVETLKEFFGKYSVMALSDPVDFSGKTGTVDRLCGLIGTMRNYYETANYVFLHGWLPNEDGFVVSDWRAASEKQWKNGRWTRWTDGRGMRGRPERKIVVCGHYPTDDSNVFYGDGFIAIDAGTATSGRLNVLVLEDEPLDVRAPDTGRLSDQNAKEGVL